MTKEIEENDEKYTISSVGGSLGWVVWRLIGGEWFYCRSGFETMEEAEAFCRR